jgi:hypothetical protein
MVNDHTVSKGALMMTFLVQLKRCCANRSLLRLDDTMLSLPVHNAIAQCAQRHSKFLASSVSPVPMYCACLGYGQSGRLRPVNALPVAITDSGAVPFSTQLTIALNMSN